MPRFNRTAVALCAVLAFVGLVIFSGRPFGDDNRAATPPPVPASGPDAQSALQQRPPSPSPDPQAEADRAAGSSGGALPRADGVQAASGETKPPQLAPARRESPASMPALMLYYSLVIVSVGLFGVSATTLWWMLHAWHSPDRLAATGFRRRHARAPRSFSLLLPARPEQAVLGDTIDALARLEHPYYEVIVVIGHDDPETERIARMAAARHRRNVRVVMDHNVPKNKPKALNTALPHCRGDIG